MPTRLRFSKILPELWVGLGFALVGFFYLIHLDTPVLWNDEADTGTIGQSILKGGLPRVCDESGQGSLTVQPWVQYYVSALSQAAFGRSSFGVRLGFAFIGWMAFFPLLLLLRARTTNALAVTILVLLSPQVLLFQRNARYYPIVIFLFTFLLYAAFCENLSRPARYLSISAAFLLFFHSHYVAAVSVFFSLIGVTARWDRHRLGPIVVGGGIGLLSWLPALFLASSLEPSTSFIFPLLIRQPGRWLRIFLNGMGATLGDLDFCNALPLFAYLAIGGYAFKVHRSKFKQIMTDPVVATIFLALLTEACLISASIGYETTEKQALLRYFPHLFPFLPLPLFFLLDGIVKKPAPALALFALVLTVNAFDWSAWRPIAPPRQWHYSWWPPVYSEILVPPPDAQLALINAIHEAPESRERLFSVSPEYLTGTFLFYTD